MYHAQPSSHNFSPQRRQILGGANKRLSPAKAQLGNDEAVNVGPGKLFADLKHQTSGKKATSSSSAAASNVFGKSSKLRAFGQEKSNQSPQRNTRQPDAGDVPVKPQQSQRTSDAKGKSTQLISPSKLTKKADSIFLASSSPTKRKKKEEASALKTPGAPSIKVDEEKMKRLALFTPETNVGHAGAMRQRLGEMLDAMAKGDVSVEQGLPTSQPEAQPLDDEDLYPEIEYMPDKEEVPYDFPPEMDGLPRGGEMGEILNRFKTTSFLTIGSSEPASKQVAAQMSSDIPEVSLLDKVLSDEDASFWPDVEEKERFSKPGNSGREASKAAGSAYRTNVPLRSIGAKSAQPSRIQTVKVSRAPTTQPSTRSIQSKPSLPSKIPKAKKALVEKNGNTASSTKHTMNPALSDFKNDRLGKISQQKLAAFDEIHTEGFIL